MISLKKIFISAICILFLLNSLWAQKTSTTLAVKGLKEKVEVLRDEWGVNHIYALNQHDLFFTQGYCAAKDRLFQFEVWRRQATGTVAEILGERALKKDIGTRLFKFRGDLTKELNHYHPQGVAIINAYVDGVNQYIEEILKTPAALPIEFKLLKISPVKWTQEVVISRHQGLLGNISQELNLGMAVAKAGDEKVKDIVWFHPKDPLLKLDTAIRGDLLKQDILSLYNASHSDIVFQPGDLSMTDEDADAVMNLMNNPLDKSQRLSEPEMEGSNNWIISGSKTASGFPMLANDPHRKIAVPSLRYMVHLVAPGWNVIGGGEPEIPGVSIGHNQYGAWGLTIYETDGEDLYVYDLNPANNNQYKYKGNWVSMKTLQETIIVKNAKPVTVSLQFTQHGPVTYIDSVNHKAYAIRCAWMEPGGAPYLASLRINQATNWEEFREACSYSHIPGENMIWADRKGNIGWQTVGIVPIRKNFSGYVPVPGDGRYEWQGYLPVKERPHLLNPTNGFFATANQHVTPDTYTHWDAVGYTWADAFRGDRINAVLSEKNKITLSDMAALQTDYYSIPASKLVPMMQSIAFTDTLMNDAKSRILNWNYVLDKNSIAAAIYVMWERQIIVNTNKQFIPAELKGLLNMQLTKVINKISIAENKTALLKESFEQAIALLKVKLGNNINTWVYGQAAYKHITFQHPLSKKLNIGTMPRGGSGSTPGSTGNADNQLSGASFRLLVDTENWDKTLMINTPGQSGNPSSPYYKNLFELWATDQYFPSYYSKEKIKSVTKESMLMVPQKK
ncbi:MAG: penicillin [Chitinophagaceae bacterium]|nr:MAG: penicillin [Chitinophagaceae bacterium]